MLKTFQWFHYMKYDKSKDEIAVLLSNIMIYAQFTAVFTFCKDVRMVFPLGLGWAWSPGPGPSASKQLSCSLLSTQNL